MPLASGESRSSNHASQRGNGRRLQPQNPRPEPFNRQTPNFPGMALPALAPDPRYEGHHFKNMDQSLPLSAPLSGFPVRGSTQDNASTNCNFQQREHAPPMYQNWAGASPATSEHDMIQQFAQAIHAVPIEEVHNPQSLPPNIVATLDKDLNRIIFVLENKKTYVTNLTEMSKALGISVSGLKKAKLERLSAAARRYHSLGDYQSLSFMRCVVDEHSPVELRPVEVAPNSSNRVFQSQLAQNRRGQRLGTHPGPKQNSCSSSDIPGWSSASPTSGVNPLVAPGANKGGALSFRLSPFYQLNKMIGSPVFFLKPHMKRRPTQLVSFDCNPVFLEIETSGVFLVCQEFNPQAGDQQPIYFPFYNEIELDGEILTANTRGVRGVVGSARPVDLKPILIKRRGRHRLRITIVVNDQGEKVSDKSFAFAIYYGQKMPHEKLVEQIKARPHIDLNQTKSMAMKAASGEEGDDVVVSSDAIYSLKDSIMMTRISVPIRSRACTHIETFDALTFIMLQDQAETWKCPVCNRTVTWESLAVDDFFAEILSQAGPEVESVAIKADGTWSVEETDSTGDDETDSDDDHKTAFKRPRSKLEEEVVDLLSETDDELTSNPVRPPVQPPQSQPHRSQPPQSQPPQSQPPRSQPPQSQHLQSQVSSARIAGTQSSNESSVRSQQKHNQHAEIPQLDSLKRRAWDPFLSELSSPHAEVPIGESQPKDLQSDERSPTSTDNPRQEILKTLQAFGNYQSVIFDAPQRTLDQYQSSRVPVLEPITQPNTQQRAQPAAPHSSLVPIMYPDVHFHYADQESNSPPLPVQTASEFRSMNAQNRALGSVAPQTQVTNGNQLNGQTMKIRYHALSRLIDDDEDDIIDLTMD